MLRELTIALSVAAVCVVIHTGTMVLLLQSLMNRRAFFETRSSPIIDTTVLVGIFAAIVCLHLVEAVIWATYYYASSLFQDYETSLYFSLTSYTTIGYGDVLLPQRWRLLGAIEGVSGVLLCGLSTAFLFAIVNRLLELRIQKRENVLKESGFRGSD